jgi:mannonate dehydratase
MTQTMRWFGPSDPVRLAEIRQTGAVEVVTALHEVANGDVWTLEAITARKTMVEAAGLAWTVVESLPVQEQLKTRGPEWDRLIAAYQESLRNLAAAGVRVVTYNFMPLLDWTRTDLAFAMPDGALALRFEWEALAAYDIHILRRPGAEGDYAPTVLEAAEGLFRSMSDDQRKRLERTILAGLPGSEESFTSAQFLRAIETYTGVDADGCATTTSPSWKRSAPRRNELGLRLVVHPRRSPLPHLRPAARGQHGERSRDLVLPRFRSGANGLCFCAGSFGARADNDLPGMIARFGDRIGFLHLRSVAREASAPSMRPRTWKATPGWPAWWPPSTPSPSRRSAASRCVPTTGTRCSTTSRRPRTPATR